MPRPLPDAAPDIAARPVLLVGAGGHAAVLLDLIRALGRPVHGLCDADPTGPRRRFPGATVIGDDAAGLALPPDAVAIAIGVGSTGSTAARARLYALYADRGFDFATLVHPSAVVAPDVALGRGAQVMAGAVIQTGARIGANAVINTAASVDHDSAVGDHAFVSPGATLCGGVEIGAGAHVGAGATVIEYRRVGMGATVGAGAVVIADVPDGATVVGVPGRIAKAAAP